MSKNTWKHKTRRYIPHIVIWYINILIYYISLCMVIQCHTVSYSVIQYILSTIFQGFFKARHGTSFGGFRTDWRESASSTSGGLFLQRSSALNLKPSNQGHQRIACTICLTPSLKVLEKLNFAKRCQEYYIKKNDKQWQISDSPLSWAEREQPARATSWHQELALGRAAAKASLILDALPDSGFSDGMGEARK